SGPRSHANFLRFASLMFFHEMFRARQSIDPAVEIPPSLTDAQLSHPRWEGAIAALFDHSDRVAKTYVTHLDDSALRVEEVFYGPEYNSRRAYGQSVNKTLFTDPVWLECYVVPQRELRLAVEGSTEHTVYRGNARVRKVVDLNGDDLEPLYDDA